MKARWRWMKAVSAPESGLSSTQRLVALTMALHASSDGGDVFPGPRRLAAETGLSERTVKRARRELVEAGWLDLERRATGAPGVPNGYRLTFPTGDTPAPVSEVHGCNEEREGVQLTTATGDTGSPNSSNYTDETTDTGQVDPVPFIADARRHLHPVEALG